jgi:putative phage-type endonuclease
MKLINLQQGTAEWHAHRARHFNASDAPAMLGVSPYKTRAELLREMHTGMTAEVDAATQRLFDDGHRSEALARPLAEEIIGDDLYPAVGTEGPYSASFDGLTLDGKTIFEHKRLNDALRAAFSDMETIAPEHRESSSWRSLPAQYRAQMEHQLMVSGASRCLFMASRWAADGTLLEAHHCWYYPAEDMRKRIVAGWERFSADLAAYVLSVVVAPEVAGRAPDTLPALRIEVTGAVTASNLVEFKSTALAAIRSVNRELRTDQDFADAEKAVKWCIEVESRLKAAKEHALSQTADIDALFKALDDITAEARTVRLDLDKLVKRRKDEVREHAVLAARRELDAHIADLNGELAPVRLQPVAVDFAAAIKGLRSIASMQDALDNALANGKIAADAQARVIRTNIATFKARAEGHEALFADLHLLVHKQADDFAAVVEARIAKHQADEAAREAKRKAEEAERIAQAEQRAREQEAARIAAAAAAAKAAEAARITEGQSSQQVLKAEPAMAEATDRGATANISPRGGAMGAGQAAAAAPTGDEPATLKLGVICERLGFTVTAAFLADVLHITPAATDKNAKLYRESQWPLICRQIMAHVSAMGELYSREVA